MITIPQGLTLYLYTVPVDMRKSIDGLNTLIFDTLHHNPQSGDIYVFRNKSSRKVKLVFWNKNGFVLYYKRLETGKFQFSKSLQEDTVLINATQLQALLIGIDFYLLGQNPVATYEHFF